MKEEKDKVDSILEVLKGMSYEDGVKLLDLVKRQLNYCSVVS